MSAHTTGFSAPGGWSFDGVPDSSEPHDLHQRNAPHTTAYTEATTSENNSAAQPDSDTPPKQEQRSWKPRTCRICLETVHPTFPTLSESLPSMLQGAPEPVYMSEDCGRLIRPCKCKGSQRYVHAGCLQEWRYADPLNKRNYWQCPTCGFQYRLTRMTWARWISSSAMQIGLTAVIFMLAIFVLGFIADPIINMYIDPIGSLAGDISNPTVHHLRNGEIVEVYDEDGAFEEGTWSEHFLKGFGAMGIIGFLKMFLAAGPFGWFNARGTYFNIGGGGRPGATGRDRVSNINWVVLVLGAVTFLYTVWVFVRKLSKRMLEKASESVLDVPLGPGEKADDDEDDNE